MKSEQELRTKWVDTQILNFKNLQGEILTKIIFWEMALIENPGKLDHVWSRPEMPFQQLNRLFLFTQSGRIYVIHTYQDDETCGLICEAEDTYSAPPAAWSAPDSIFRVANPTTFPLSLVSRVDLILNADSNISRVSLIFPDRTIVLQAGEVYENLDGTLKIVRDDESILYFPNQEDVDRIVFT